MLPRRTMWALALLSLLLSSCTMHSTARHWSGRVGARGKHVYLKSSTNVGLNLLVFIPVPFMGSTTLDMLTRDLTEEIAAEEGDRIRVFQTSTENYWYGFQPFTWILTPVISNVSAEYEPSLETRVRDHREEL